MAVLSCIKPTYITSTVVVTQVNNQSLEVTDELSIRKEEAVFGSHVAGVGFQ